MRVPNHRRILLAIVRSSELIKNCPDKIDNADGEAIDSPTGASNEIKNWK